MRFRAFDRDGGVQRDAARLAEILASPSLFPVGIDLRRKTLLFARLSQDEYRGSTFLDERTLRSKADVYSVDLNQLTAHLSSRTSPAPVHYILHGGFCCSTLLARYLETMSGAFVVKEPALLTELSTFRLFKNVSLDFADFEDDIAAGWQGWLHLNTLLLARTHEPGAAVIVKANDLCNWMGDLLLAQDDRTKILFLASPLRVFVLSVLKYARRRVWIRNRLRALARCIAAVPFLAQVVTDDLTDEECAAAVWLLNGFLCHYLLRSAPHRVLALDGENIARRPHDALRATAEFLELVDETGGTARLTAAPLLNHAKDLDLPYDEAARATDLERAADRFGSEAEAAIAWATQVASEWIVQCPFDLR